MIEQTKRENTKTMLHRNEKLKYKIIFSSFIVGLMVGGIIIVYRLIGQRLFEHYFDLITRPNLTTKHILLIFAALILASLFVSFCVKQEPQISGSGIPQIKGIVTRKLEVNWWKVLIYKFFGGAVCLACGLSVGREGPSVQMGGAVGEGYSKLTNKYDYEHKYLITSGACAGLAAAFNAPFAGIMFGLEEVHKNFSPIGLISAMVASVTADVTAKSILGIRPALSFDQLEVLPVHYYWVLVLLGVVAGLSSYLFNHGIVFSKTTFSKWKVPTSCKIAIPFLMSGVLGLLFPAVLGGGHHLIMDMNVAQTSILTVSVILCIKYVYTFISFGSGVPGGIFFPLLALGALIGNIVGLIGIYYLGIPEVYLVNFTILAMAGHFAAIVKAPMTAVILIFEMTGSFAQLLPLVLVVLVAMITSDLAKVKPIYDALLERILKTEPTPYKGQKNNKTLLELSVHLQSFVAGKRIKEITWPKNCLLVAIKRGTEEIIPKGDTMIIEGDMLLIIVNQEESEYMLEELSSLTS